MELSDHAHILHTEVFEGEEFNEKSLICRTLTVLEIIEFKINEFFCILPLCLWEFIDFGV